jgi:adenylylsulfate kinase-like enzyme
MQPKSRNITRVSTLVSRGERELLMGQRGVTVWFTGLSASST